MSSLPEHLTPERWLAQVFASREAQRGGVIKRQVRDVERLVGHDLFMAAVRARGFQVLRNGRHYVIFCNGAEIRRVR